MKIIKTISAQKTFIITQYEQGHTTSYILNAYKYKFGKSISRQYVHQVVATTTEYKERKFKLSEVKEIICLKCNHRWTPRKLETPRVCPHCYSAYYDTVAKKGNYKRKIMPIGIIVTR